MEGPVSQIHSPHLHDGVSGIFSNFLRSVKILRPGAHTAKTFLLYKCTPGLKREWGAESNGKLPHLFISSKTAIVIPELVAGRSALRWKLHAVS